ncbi:hypothetical protein BH09PSE2_BH09PSE2_03010 [soil metagenome]
MTKMIDEVANFTKAERKLAGGEPFVMTENVLTNRELHIYLPVGRVDTGQAAQIQIARDYADKRGVKLITRLVH